MTDTITFLSESLQSLEVETGLKKGGLALGESVFSIKKVALSFSDTGFWPAMVIWGREERKKGGLCLHKQACMSARPLFGSTPENCSFPKPYEDMDL